MERYVDEFRRIALSQTGVILSVGQIIYILKSDQEIHEELQAGSLSDTYARDLVAQAIVDMVMDGTPAPDLSPHDSLFPGGQSPYWYWPLNGSSAAYRDTFVENFVRCAEEKGIVLIDNWVELW